MPEIKGRFYANPAYGEAMERGRDAESADGKVSQEDAGYEDPADHCEDCVHFQGPDACALVTGTIAESGWCTLYKEGMEKEESEGEPG